MSNEEISRLERLTQLFQQGALSESEFEQQKQAILNTTLTPIPLPEEVQATGHNLPLIDEDEPPKNSWGKWFLIGFIALLAISMLLKGKENKEVVTEATTKTTPLVLPIHELLKQDGPPSARSVNLWFLTENLSRDTNQIKRVATALIKEYCADKTCNQVYFWRSKEAFELEGYEQSHFSIENFDYDKDKWLKAEYKWKDKHWPFVCENLAATYDNNSGLLEYEPYMDSDYREHGGKKKRVPLSSTTLTIDVPKFKM